MPKSASDSPSLVPSRKFDRDMQVPPETQVVIDFDDNRAVSSLVGPYGQNLAQIERRLSARKRWGLAVACVAHLLLSSYEGARLAWFARA